MSAVVGGGPALRIAWRDALRSRARSALVLVMIALPVLAVTAADVLYRTQQISAAEGVSRRLGGADARLEVAPWTQRVFQGADPDQGQVAAAGGEDQIPPTLADLADVLGRRLRGIETLTGEIPVETAKGVSSVEVTEIDLRDPLAAPLWNIDRGRAAESTEEVVVNGALAERGVDLGDRFTMPKGGSLRVVGVGDSTTRRGLPLAISLPGAFGFDRGSGGERAHTWLVDAGGPVTWDDTLALNSVGVTVLSRHLLNHPPSASDLPDEVAQMNEQSTDGSLIAVVALIVTMALLEVVLLAGPAFAVGARRASRTLALMAVSGGTPAQSRRVILGGGLVLGGLAASLGAGLGIGAAWLVLPNVQSLSTTVFGPFEVAWAHVAAIVAFGLLSAVLAAVVPAWIVSRQDIVSVLAGRRGDRRPRASTPLAGVALLAIGAGSAVYGAASATNGEVFITGAAVISVVGMVLVIPLVVATVAQVAARFPLPMRYAARDAARHRTRTVPAVAAVAATVAGVVALGIATASDSAENRARYIPRTVEGVGVVVGGEQASPEDWLRVSRIVKAELPQASVMDVVAPVGMDSELTLGFSAGGRDVALETYGSMGPSVLVAPVLPAPLLGVSDEVRARADQALARGGVVVFVTQPVDAGEVRVTGQRWSQEGERRRTLTPTRLPAAFVSLPELADKPRAILSDRAAQRLGLAVCVKGVVVVGGDITAEQQQDISERVAAVLPYSALYVERGFQPDDATRVVLLILTSLGGVLMLGGTLTATFLALSDARPDLATLSAIGAAPRSRRLVAAAYALVIGLVGSLLGAGVGFIPGIAITYQLTGGPAGAVDGAGRAMPTHFIDVPWGLVTGLVVALPLATAVVVGLLARSRLPLVARLG